MLPLICARELNTTMKKYLSILSLLILSVAMQAQSDTTGSIAGKLSDNEVEGQPLPFANVIIKETNKGTTSDFDGLYSLKNIEPGTYTVEFSFIGYETLQIPNVEVVSGKVTEINTGLGASAAALDEVVISTVSRKDSEVALLLEQKNAIQIQQSIGAEELSRKAVTNVEQGVSKVSGITMVQDRGIFVRGLDDRYNYLMINGLPVASSDPDFKIIPLSYISTNIVSSVDVLKTFSPSLYSDFAGATFKINTPPAPAKPTTTINFGFNYNTNTTFKDFLTDNSGDSEFLGYTGAGRSLPAELDINSLSLSASPEESAGLFNTSWTPESKNAPLDTRFGISHGQRLFANDRENLGFVFSMNYRNFHRKQNGVERTLNSEGTAGQNFTSTNYNFSTQKSALLSLDYTRFNKLNLSFNTIYLQNSSNFIREAYGRNDGFTQLNNRDFFIRDMRYTENDQLTLQLTGNLEFEEKKHQIHFGASAGLGNNEVPDRRVLRAAGVGEDANYITTNGINPFKFYQSLENMNVNSRLEYELGFDQNEEGDYNTVFKIGHNLDHIEYQFYNRFITAQVNRNNLPNLNTNNPQDFFNQGFNEGFLSYNSTFDPTAASKIDQTINAGYLTFFRKWDRIILEAGLRAEHALREIIFREPLDRPQTPYQKLAYEPFDFNPSINLRYELNENSNLRFTSSITNTRPRLREILPTVYQNGDGNQVIGNPDLLNSTNYNLDIKYEIFPTSSELFAITAFGKYLEDPIERLARSTSVGYRTFFDNFEEAYLYGLEMEARVNLGNITKAESLDDLSFGFNGILMNSVATADANNPRFAVVTNKERQLQGASNWGLNADLGYELIDTEKTESQINLIFNTYGKRIYAVGVEGADEIYEKPMNQLDLSWNTEFNDHIGVKLTVRNILNEETLFTQDPTQEVRFPDRFSNVVESFDLGTTFGVNVTYKF
ncbi:Outer membrane receptor proteins, mostly Fe transport [Salegentibacter salinarum]|nr:Outer membrane receptor proteins, mostly Fe transport [Salegentibacter salinarum]